VGSRLGWLAGATHWAARHRRGTWLAQGYAAAVAAVAVGIQILPAGTASAVVPDSSTNLHNLHHDPLVVLAASAFVVSSPAGLWILPVLLVVYGAAQRWLGAAATIVAAALGHIGATLLVAVLLAAGIGDGRLDPAVADARDVEVSYGLVTVAAVLTARFRGVRQLGYALAVLGSAPSPRWPTRTSPMSDTCSPPRSATASR
jgi:hypothetical protein